MITFLEFLSQRGWSDILILLNNFQALLISDPLITLWGHFKAPYFKMLNDARVASACFYVRTCQRVRNSKFCNYTQLPSSKFILLFVNSTIEFLQKKGWLCTWSFEITNLLLKFKITGFGQSERKKQGSLSESHPFSTEIWGLKCYNTAFWKIVFN